MNPIEKLADFMTGKEPKKPKWWSDKEIEKKLIENVGKFSDIEIEEIKNKIKWFVRLREIRWGILIVGFFFFYVFTRSNPTNERGAMLILGTIGLIEWGISIPKTILKRKLQRKIESKLKEK